MESLEHVSLTTDKLLIIGKLDLSRHPELRKDVERYKWERSYNAGFDIGLIQAVLGYFSDNPSSLCDPSLSYFFEDKTGDKKKVHDSCVSLKESCSLQINMIPLEIIKNRYFRSEEVGIDIGKESAEMDFYKNRFESWAKRCRVSLCVLCTESIYCKLGQKIFNVFFNERH